MAFFPGDFGVVSPLPADGSTVPFDTVFGGSFGPAGAGAYLRQVVLTLALSDDPEGLTVFQATEGQQFPLPDTAWHIGIDHGNFVGSATVNRAGGTLSLVGKGFSPWLPGTVVTANWFIFSETYDVHNNPKDVYQSNESYTFTLAPAIPHGRDFDPLPDAINVAPNTHIKFALAVALSQTIVHNDTVIKIRVNGGTQVTAYSLQTWRNGYNYAGVSGPIHDNSGTEDVWTYDILPPAPFSPGDVVEVEVTGQDNLGNPFFPAILYSFTISTGPVDPTSIPSGEAFGTPRFGLSAPATLSPTIDTIRGGRLVVGMGQVKLVDPEQDTSFLAQSLPVDWTSSTAGTGRVRPMLAGLLLQTGHQTASSATLTAPTKYTDFDLQLRCSCLSPDQADGGGPIELLNFEFWLDGANYARIQLRRDPLYGSRSILANSELGQDAEIYVGGAQAFDLRDFVLRIVRHENYLFLFANDLPLAATSRFSTAGPGLVRLSCANLSTLQVVSTQLEDLTVRSHALISGRLLTEKVDFSAYRITGRVPEATLEEAGLCPVVLFGPWGSSTFPDGFEYVLPNGRTVGKDLSNSLKAYADSAVKD